MGKCPIPTHPGDGNNERAFTFLENRGIWSCWTHECHKKYGNDIIGFIRAYYECDFQEACYKLAKLLNTDVSFKKIKKDRKQEIKQLLLRDTAESCEIVPERFLRAVDCKHPYMLGRGFQRELLQEENIGFFRGNQATEERPESFMANRIIFPVRDLNGQLVGFTGRSVIDDEALRKRHNIAKWKHSADLHRYKRFPKLSLLYNIHIAKKYLKNGTLFVAEGPIDVLRFKSIGIQNSCAVLGSDLGNQQERLIRSIGTRLIVPVFDQDESGIKCREKLKKRFKGLDLIKVKEVELPDYKDPGDLTEEELKELFHEYVS